MTANNSEPHKDKDMNKDTSLDTSLIDEQWQALTQDWQQQPTVKTDIQKLLKKTKRRTREAKYIFVANVVATVGLIISALYGTFVEDSWERPLLGYLWGSAVLSIIFCYYELKIRLTTWKQINDSPEQAIQNAIKGHQSSLSYIRLTKWSCLPFGILANFFVYESAINAEKSPLTGLMLINVFIFIMWGITHWFGVKRKKELKTLLARNQN
ncbi:hypothetical protein [Thalassotalea sediminis]|uniref:hypothetical protein n=1 Tax=Thalassotalea sediminis TaxID=1759089 RepID=UPI002573815A|nr:hypothetical protein [Thalassotalea sediminis]